MKSEPALFWTLGPLIFMCIFMYTRLGFAVSPIRGTVEKISKDSITIDSSLGKIKTKLSPEVQFFKRIPSDLSRVSSKSYVGVTTIKQADGKDVATEIHIFPEHMRGTNEGSFMMENSDHVSTKDRMTNGTVTSAQIKTKMLPSRMTNGTVGKIDGSSTMVVHYKGGELTIMIPDNVIVTEVVTTQERPPAGAPIAFLPEKKSDGSYTTSRITIISPAVNK